MGDGEWREREVDAHNFRCSCARGGCYSCGFCIFEVPLGWGTGSGERGKWMPTTFGAVAPAAVVTLVDSVFLRYPWDGGRGVEREGSGWPQLSEQLPARRLLLLWILYFEAPLGWEKRGGKEREKLLVSAFGGLLRDPIGSTVYWEIDRAVMRFI